MKKLAAILLSLAVCLTTAHHSSPLAQRGDNGIVRFPLIAFESQALAPADLSSPIIPRSLASQHPPHSLEEQLGETSTLWRDHLKTSRDIYDRHLDAIRRTPRLAEKIKILNQIREFIISRMEHIKRAEEETATLIFPTIASRQSPWDIDLSLNAVPEWDGTEIDSYYYHGTSLGIAIAAALGYGLGGYSGLREGIGVVNHTTGGRNTFLARPEFHRTPGDPQTISNLGSIIRQGVWYADLSSRPVASLFGYYALRAMWEGDLALMNYAFPPFQYFQQRAILRIPKTSVFNIISHDEDPPEVYSKNPVSLQHADVLLDKDIPLPRQSIDDYSAYIGIYDFGSLRPEDYSPEERPWLRTVLAPYPHNEVHSRLNSIGNTIMPNWKPIRGLLPHTNQAKAIAASG